MSSVDHDLAKFMAKMCSKDMVEMFDKTNECDLWSNFRNLCGQQGQ